MAELADAQDLKSCVHLVVRVRPSVGVYGVYRYLLTRTRDYYLQLVTLLSKIFFYLQKAICPLSRRFLRIMRVAEKGA